jgi:hypothetical protein
MHFGLIDRVLRRGPTRDEAFDRFAFKTAPAVAPVHRASSAAQHPATLPEVSVRALKRASERQQPAASAARPDRVSVS